MYMMAPRTYRPSHPILSGLQTNTLDAGRRGVVFGVASGAGDSLVKIYPLTFEVERLASSRDLGDGQHTMEHSRSFTEPHLERRKTPFLHCQESFCTNSRVNTYI